MAIKNDGIKVNKVNKDIFLRLVCEPTFLFFVKKYKFKLFLNTIRRNIVSKITSKTNKTCKLIFENDINFGLIKARKVSMLSPIQIIDSEIIVLKPFNLLNIKNINNLYKHNIV